MAQGISLANKCQILFGAAVLALLAGALSVPWHRTGEIVTESQLEVSRQLAETWFENGFSIGRSEGSQIPMRVVEVDDILFGSDEALGAGAQDPPGGGGADDRSADADGDDDDARRFLAASLAVFEGDPDVVERFERQRVGTGMRYRYARAIREREWRTIADRKYLDWRPRGPSVRREDALAAILLIDRTSQLAEAQILQNRIYIAAAGLGAWALSILLFHRIMKRLIFRPVRALAAVAVRVEQG